MLKLSLSSLVFLLALAPLSAQAGGQSSGGGGNAVVCFKDAAVAARVRAADGMVQDANLDQITSIEMLDLREAKGLRQLDATPAEMIPLEAGEKPDEYVERIKNRMMRYVPELSTLIQDGQNQFPAHMIRWEDLGVYRVHDMGVVSPIPGNCAWVTMAVQVGTDDLSQLIIDPRLFNHRAHSDLSRAVLFLHEYLYVMARKDGEPDAMRVRQVVGHLITRAPGFPVGDLLTLAKSVFPSQKGYFMSGRDAIARSMVGEWYKVVQDWEQEHLTDPDRLTLLARGEDEARRGNYTTNWHLGEMLNYLEYRAPEPKPLELIAQVKALIEQHRSQIEGLLRKTRYFDPNTGQIEPLDKMTPQEAKSWDYYCEKFLIPEMSRMADGLWGCYYPGMCAGHADSLERLSILATRAAEEAGAKTQVIEGD